MTNYSPPPGTPQTGHKAILAGLLAGLATLLATLQGRTDLDTMRPVDWMIVALGALVTGLGAYLMPNRPK